MRAPKSSNHRPRARPPPPTTLAPSYSPTQDSVFAMGNASQTQGPASPSLGDLDEARPLQPVSTNPRGGVRAWSATLLSRATASLDGPLLLKPHPSRSAGPGQPGQAQGKPVLSPRCGAGHWHTWLSSHSQDPRSSATCDIGPSWRVVSPASPTAQAHTVHRPLGCSGRDARHETR